MSRVEDLVLGGFPGEFALAYGGISPAGLDVLGLHDNGQSFPFASISKLCTALAILVAVEEEVLDLTEEIGSRALRVQDLLGHCSGLVDSQSLEIESQDMAKLEPRRRRVYSNRGYEILASSLEERSKIPFRQYLREAVFLPASMHTAFLDPHLYPESGPSGGAAGVVGKLNDLLSLVGALSHESVVCDETLRLIRTPHLDGLGGVLPGFGPMTNNSWGLGPEVRGNKWPHWTSMRNSPATFGHFGRSGSFLWIDLEARCFCISLSSVPFGSWSKELWPRLGDLALDSIQV